MAESSLLMTIGLRVLLGCWDVMGVCVGLVVLGCVFKMSPVDLTNLRFKQI